MKRYVCRICGHVYDPLEGDRASGVEPMTSFVDLPFEWNCPECGASRERFAQENSLTPHRTKRTGTDR